MVVCNNSPKNVLLNFNPVNPLEERVRRKTEVLKQKLKY